MVPKVIPYISCSITLVFTLATLFYLGLGWIHKDKISEYNSHTSIIFYIFVGVLGFLTFYKPIQILYDWVQKSKNYTIRGSMSGGFLGSQPLGDLRPLQEMLQEGIPPFSNLVGVVTIRDLIVPNYILSIIGFVIAFLFLLLIAITHFFGINNSINIVKKEYKKLSYIATVLLAGLTIYMIISIAGVASKGFTHLSEGHTFLTVIATFFKVFIILLIAVCSCGPAIGIIQREVNLNMLKNNMPPAIITNIKTFVKSLNINIATR